ncbi:MAG TPA: histone H1 [Bacilli bacterium]|jgi:hypothetical protein|nr:histone H1 [Bacilli bacterium]
MEKIAKIYELIVLMENEAEKVYNKGNRSAATRARKYAQEIRNLLGDFRKEIIDVVKK